MDTRVNRKTAIDGVMTTDLREISDARGAVLHMIRTDAPGYIGFGECYFSEVLPGALKAWKRHRIQTQNLAVPAGRVRFVIFDDRIDSPTRGVADVVEIGRPDAYLRLTVPPMLWMGFTCVGQTPALVVNVSNYPHDPAEAEVIPPLSFHEQHAQNLLTAAAFPL